MSAGARGVFNAAYEPLLFDVARLPFPAPAASSERWRRWKREAPDAAALIVEPLMLGAGGMLIYCPEVLREMNAICERHGTLFIADEVMTGFGRTGTLFACEQAGIAPDILCLAKGLTGGALPLAATLGDAGNFRGALFHRPQPHVLSFQFLHRQSHRLRRRRRQSGDLARRAGAGRASPRWRALQEERLAPFRADPRFENVRRLGTIAALDLKVPDPGYLAGIGPELTAHFLARGVLLRPLGNTIYVMPPYCITRGGTRSGLCCHCRSRGAIRVTGPARAANDPVKRVSREPMHLKPLYLMMAAATASLSSRRF